MFVTHEKYDSTMKWPSFIAKKRKKVFINEEKFDGIAITRLNNTKIDNYIMYWLLNIKQNLHNFDIFIQYFSKNWECFQKDFQEFCCCCCCFWYWYWCEKYSLDSQNRRQLCCLLFQSDRAKISIHFAFSSLLKMLMEKLYILDWILFWVL